MIGMSFTPSFTEADAVLLAGRLAAKDTCADKELLLNLVDFDQVPLTIHSCRSTWIFFRSHCKKSAGSGKAIRYP